MSFPSRAKPHDRAMECISSLMLLVDFESAGRRGIEMDDEYTQWLLRQQYDDVSTDYRWQADQLFTRPGDRSVYCDVKTSGSTRDSFYMEADSYRALRRCDSNGQRVFVAFVNPHSYDICACWCSEIPEPFNIRIARWSEKKWEHYHRMKQYWPCANVKFVPVNGGSGTPFFLIPKTSWFLTPIDEFLRRL